MIRLMMAGIIVLIATGMATPVFAQPSQTSRPTPVATIPNVTTSGLPEPGGGLFKPNSSSTNRVIHFPNLISSFTSGDFLQDIFRFVLDILATVSGLLAFGYFLYGAVKFVIAGGNPAPVEEGKKIMVGSIVGMLIISLAYVVTVYVRSLLNSL